MNRYSLQVLLLPHSLKKELSLNTKMMKNISSDEAITIPCHEIQAEGFLSMYNNLSGQIESHMVDNFKFSYASAHEWCIFMWILKEPFLLEKQHYEQSG